LEKQKENIMAKSSVEADYKIVAFVTF